MNEDQPSVYFAARCLQVALQETPGMAKHGYTQLRSNVTRVTRRTIDDTSGGIEWASSVDELGIIGAARIVAATVAVTSAGDEPLFTAALTVTGDGARCVVSTASTECEYEGALTTAVSRFVAAAVRP